MAAQSKRVLISGASIAGPALAYWLHQYGFEVTIVERSSGIRGGGYAIDIRGTAVDVVDRMGILPSLAKKQIHMRAMTFVNTKGKAIGKISIEALATKGKNKSLELPRGDLTTSLYEATHNAVEYRFNNSVASLTEDAHGVDVEFFSGAKERYEIVVGADGVHSSTRAMSLGPEADYTRYLGYCFALFEMPNTLKLSREGMMYNKPGKTAALYATGDAGSSVHVLLVNKRPLPTPSELRNTQAMRQFMAEAFTEHDWLLPEIISQMKAIDFVFADAVLQVHMPEWSKGRVALAGDSAYCPSFMSGQGTSVSLVGAYVLAGCLAAHQSHTEAFAAYDKTMRPYIEANQEIADDGKDLVAPDSAMKIWLRNRLIGLAPLLGRLGLISERRAERAHNLLDLPHYHDERPHQLRPETTSGG